MSSKARTSSHPENARPGFKGEKHPRLKTTKGRIRGNFLGPGTNVVARVKRGDRGINFSDRVAEGHDLRYSVAKDVNAVRSADLKMIATLKHGRKTKRDFLGNLVLAEVGIRTKVQLENLGLSRTFFATFGGDLPPADDKLIRARLAVVKRQGFGASAGPGAPPVRARRRKK